MTENQPKERKGYKKYLRDENAEIPRKSKDYHSKRKLSYVPEKNSQNNAAKCPRIDERTDDLPRDDNSPTTEDHLPEEGCPLDEAEKAGPSHEHISDSDWVIGDQEEHSLSSNSSTDSSNEDNSDEIMMMRHTLSNAPRIRKNQNECHPQVNAESITEQILDGHTRDEGGENIDVREEGHDIDVDQYLDEENDENGSEEGREELSQSTDADTDNNGSDDNSTTSEEETHECPPVSHKKLKQKLQEQPDFTSPILTPVSASPAEVLLMILTMHQQNNSSFKAFVDSSKLVNSIFVSPVLPKSAYMLDQLLSSEEGILRYFYCSDCSHLFGLVNNQEIPSVVCPEEECGAVNNIHDLTKASYLALYPLPVQIELLLKDKDIRSKLKTPKDLVQMQEPNIMSDLYGGQCYRKFALSLPDDNVIVISFTMSTDGSPLFTSSNFSIWPCFVSVNELPADIRMKNLLLVGLFFGYKKPHMDLYLKPIAEHLNSLSKGFKVDVGEGVETENLDMEGYTIGCCVDSGARGDVQGLNTHSGYYSCNWCEISGEWMGKVIFPFQEEPPKRRTHEDVVEYARECSEDKRLAYVYGVRYLSCLASIEKFDIVNGMILDYAHNIPFGISRTFLGEWLSNSIRGCYIGAPSDIEELDEKISSLTPPLEVRRAVRKFSDRAFWNAREFENYTRFYSLLVLEGMLPLKYLTSWSHLVQGFFLLSRASVSIEDISNARKLLLHFEKDCVALYGRYFSTYNLHICGQHLAENTVRWGPTFAVNSLCYEAGIKDMKGLLHAQRGVPHQIHRAISYKQAHRILTHASATPATKLFAADIVAKPNKGNTHFPYPECVVIGPCRSFQPEDDEEFVLQHSEFEIDVQNCDMFHKVIHKKCVFTSDSFAVGKKFNNSCATTVDGRVVLLKKFVVDKTNEKVYVYFVEALCQVFLKMPQDVRISPVDHCLRIVTSFAGRLELKSVTYLKTICFFSKMNGKMYIGEFPNIINTF